MTVDQLNKKIKTKFGSVSKFCRIVAIDRYEITKLFAAARKKMTPEREQEIKKLNKLAVKTSSRTSDKEIDRRLIIKIRKAIEKLGGVRSFCQDNPEFNEVNVYQILEGKRKFKTKKVNNLITKLKIS